MAKLAMASTANLAAAAAAKEEQDSLEAEEEAAEEEEEEAAAEEEEVDDDFEADDAAEEIEESEAVAPTAPPVPSAATSAAWGSLASVLAVGSDLAASSSREKLFEQLDTDADGQLSMEEIETALPSVLSEVAGQSATPALRSPLPPSVPLLREAVSRGFEAAKNLATSLVVRDASLSRDGFDRVVGYLHVTSTLLHLLGTPIDAKTIEEFDAAAFAALVPRLPRAWAIDVVEASATFEALEEEQRGYVHCPRAHRRMLGVSPASHSCHARPEPTRPHAHTSPAHTPTRPHIPCHASAPQLTGSLPLLPLLPLFGLAAQGRSGQRHRCAPLALHAGACDFAG